MKNAVEDFLGDRSQAGSNYDTYCRSNLQDHQTTCLIHARALAKGLDFHNNLNLILSQYSRGFGFPFDDVGCNWTRRIPEPEGLTTTSRQQLDSFAPEVSLRRGSINVARVVASSASIAESYFLSFARETIGIPACIRIGQFALYLLLTKSSSDSSSFTL